MTGGLVRAAAEITVWGAVLFGLAVVSISAVSPVELAVAGAAASGGAVAARRMRRAAGAEVTGVRGAARAVPALPRAVLRGLAALVVAVVARPTGATVRSVRLKPEAHAGWAAALLAASPDTCVIDVPREDTAVVHALRPEAGPLEEVVSQAGGSR
ncbi:hypothetical protein [Streptomyces palmae]|uniref:hypothetical protein n=1 Tax=Streptomyces palmae TaxID=1701085 RepID=UPI001FD7F0B5|nr:hypothetical protein [Streptomyces palmae]